MIMNHTPNDTAGAQGQIFKNPVLEILTKAPPQVSALTYLIVIAGLILMSWNLGKIDQPGNAILWFFGAFVFWTFFEYFAHRYFFHLDHYFPNSKLAARLSYIFHGIHHDYPKDKQRLAMPPVLSVVIGTILLLIFELVLDKYSFSTLAGFMTGYAFYLLVHYSVHIFRPPNNILKELWKNHAIHHYKDDSIMYGVSSPIWDYVFRTLPKDKDMKRNLEVKGGV